MTNRELFAASMADLGAQLGKDFATGEDAWTVSPYGGTVNVSFSYRPALDLVLVTVPVVSVANMPHSAAARAWMLLTMNAFYSESRGCTLAIDPETGMLVALDRRSVAYFATAGAIGDYVRRVADFVRELARGVQHLEDAAEVALEGDDGNVNASERQEA